MLLLNLRGTVDLAVVAYQTNHIHEHSLATPLYTHIKVPYQLTQYLDAHLSVRNRERTCIGVGGHVIADY